MRLKNSVKNLITVFLGQFVLILAKFVVRRYFSYSLSVEYLGFESVIQNIVDLLSVFELGISGVIGYALYKPLAENNSSEIRGLMNLYAKIYKVLALVILAVGMAVLPLLGVISEGVNSIEHYQLIYIINVLGVSVSFLFMHLSTYASANQENYIYYYNHFFWEITKKIVQIYVLVKSQSLLLFAVSATGLVVLEGITLFILAYVRYPYLSNRKGFTIDETLKEEIKSDVINMAIGRVGKSIINSTDSIVIANMLGLAISGMYSNYYMVLVGLEAVIVEIMYSIAAPIGNYMVVETIDKKQDLFWITMFVNDLIVSISSVMLLVLFNPFIEVWLGNSYVLDTNVCVLMTVSFFVYCVRHQINVFRQANGLFTIESKKAILEATVNIILSVLLTHFLGLSGVLLGTIISAVFIGWLMEIKDISKHLALENFVYFKAILKFIIYILLAICICIVILERIWIFGWLGLVLRIVISGIICLLLAIFMFANNWEIKWILKYVKERLNRH